MRAKSIVIIVIVSCAVVVAFCASLVWFVYSIFTGALIGYQPPPTPAQLKEPRIVIGKDFLSRSEFVKTTFLENVKGVGSISDVAVGEFDPHPGLDVVVAGNSGALVFDRDGVQQGRTVFQFKTSNVTLGPFHTPRVDMSLGDVKVVDLEADGVCEYLARGGMDGGAVFDHQGNMIWTYGKFSEEKTSIDALTVGDLDGDGIAEFVVSWNGIEVFDKSGKRKSQLAEKYISSPI